MKKIKIFMPLLNEGTNVSRPVIAYDMGDNIYKIIGTDDGYNPDVLEEEWLFPIGSYITCIIVQNNNETTLVANELYKF